ncbi:MAG: LamG-like jellyroll fold domain-containing protein [bacterium]
MERIQATVLTVLIAALVLFGIGYVVDPSVSTILRRGGAPVSEAAHDDGRRRIALWNSESGERRGPPVPGGGEPDRHPPRHGGAVVVGGDASADRTAPGMRRRAGFPSAGVIGADGEGGRIGTELIAARAGGIPAPLAAKPDPAPPPPKRQVLELGDPDSAANRDLLLSVPFDGDVSADKGGAPTLTDGLIVNGDSVEFTNDAQVVFPAQGNVRGSQGTISFDLDPHWAGSDLTNNSLLQIRDENQWENNLQIVKNLGALRFIIVDETGMEANVNVPISDWQPNVRHQITATWDSVGMVLYLDGRRVGATALQNGLSFGDTTPIHVGSDFPGATYAGAGGNISRLKVYGRALAGDEIASR